MAPDAVELLEKLGGLRAEDRFASGLIRYYFWNFRGARADFDGSGVGNHPRVSSLRPGGIDDADQPDVHVADVQYLYAAEGKV